MNEIPPSRAKAIAMLSSETDCIIALVKGMFIERGDSSPFLNLQRGARKETLEGTQFSDE